MVFCPKCNKEYDESSKFCTDCGTSLILNGDSSNYKNSVNDCLYFFNTDLAIDDKIMQYLSGYTNLKTTLNFKGFNETIRDNEFHVYPNYIMLDNSMFTQKIPYDMLKDITLYNRMSHVFGNSIHIILNSGDILKLTLDNKNNNQLSSLIADVKKFISNPPVRAEGNVIKVFNTEIIEQLDSLYKLDDITSFKQDISYLNQSLFEEDGLFIICDDLIKIENKIFIQEFPFRIIRSFNVVGELYELELNNNIIIKFRFDDNSLDDYIKFINEKITNPPSIINSDFTTNTQVIPQNQVLSENKQYNQQNPIYNQPIIINQKSNVLAFILNLLFCGAGYAYIDKWGRFLLTFFIIWPIMILIGFFTLMIPPLIFWIYVVLNTNTLVNKHNNGEL